jgi:endogenous inhibitor of DNA gyrase (YacG/DUF329 family)
MPRTPKTKICKQCGKEFVDKYRDGKMFCDRACYAKWQRGKYFDHGDITGENNPNWRGGDVHICLNCGKSFTDGRYTGKKFCDRECYGEYRHKMGSVVFRCIICGKEVTIHKHDEGKRKYCSTRCMGLDEERTWSIQEKRAGWTMSTEARQKISIASSRRQTGYSRGKSGWHESEKAGGKVFYRSSYEKKAFELLDANSDVASYEVEPFVIVYVDRFADTRRYRPDILVHWNDGCDVLIEVKPAWQLDDPKVLEKVTSGAAHARNNGMSFEIWTEWTLGLAQGQTASPTLSPYFPPVHSPSSKYQGQTGPTPVRP